jgi:hypothetical protein
VNSDGDSDGGDGDGDGDNSNVTRGYDEFPSDGTYMNGNGDGGGGGDNSTMMLWVTVPGLSLGGRESANSTTTGDSGLTTVIVLEVTLHNQMTIL